MRQRCAYLPEKGVVFADLAGLYADPSQVDELIDEIVRLARQAPEPPILLSCWTGAKLSPRGTERFGDRLPELYAALAGVVRYDVTDPATRIRIQTQLQRHAGPNTHDPLYTTREEAQEAVRQMRIKTP
jgi:hypothetical protein